MLAEGGGEEREGRGGERSCVSCHGRAQTTKNSCSFFMVGLLCFCPPPGCGRERKHPRALKGSVLRLMVGIHRNTRRTPGPSVAAVPRTVSPPPTWRRGGGRETRRRVQWRQIRGAGSGGGVDALRATPDPQKRPTRPGRVPVAGQNTRPRHGTCARGAIPARPLTRESARPKNVSKADLIIISHNSHRYTAGTEARSQGFFCRCWPGEEGGWGQLGQF